MNTNTLDEVSKHVQFNSIKTETKTKPLDTLLGITKEYFTSIYSYLIDRYFVGRSIVIAVGKAMIHLGYNLKSYLVSRIFWGRGPVYRYIAFFSIFVPIVVSMAIIYSNRTSPSVEKKFVLTNTYINQAANQTNQFAVQGKLVDANTPTTNNNLIISYKVKPGDTLASIASAYHVNKDVLMWANNLSSDSVTAGNTISIIPVQGLVYTSKDNDTLAKIASLYQVSATQIQAWNVFVDFSNPLAAGVKILIPGITQAPQTTYAYYTGVSSTESAGCPSDIPWCYLQSDPRWGSMILGGAGAVSSYSYINVTNSGCFITDVAMLSEYYFPQKHITPATIAYNPGNFDGGGLYNLNGLGLFNVTPLSYIWGGGVNWTAIDQHLALGQPVIVFVPYLRGHYVLLYKKVGDDYLMADPARGAGLLFSQYYNKAYVSQAYLYTPIGN
jgi:LysM repeat protein